MKRFSSSWSLLAASLLTLHVAPALADGATAPAGKPVVSIGAGDVPDQELVRGLTEQRFRSAAASTIRTSVGGYGEILVRGTRTGKDGKREWEADVARMALVVAHQFTDKLRAYTEVDVRHAVGCSTCSGSVELEQAYLDWKALGDWVGLRAGLVIVPMGIVNQWHEPPVYHGVMRPRVESVLIPSTWREIGAGVFGRPQRWLRYELYAMTGLDPMGLGAGGIVNGKQSGSLARAKAWAVAGRLEAEPLPGMVFGVSGYGSDIGPNGSFYDATSQPLDISLPIVGWAADARLRRWGLELKVLFVGFYLPESGTLMATGDLQGVKVGDPLLPVPITIHGGYVEAAYDVLRPFKLSHQLLPFVRAEAYNTQGSAPTPFVPNATYNVRELTFGLTYRPIQQIVLKADVQLRDKKLGFDQSQVNFGLGFMY